VCRLCVPPKTGGHGLDRGADDVVERVLGREARARRLAVRAQHEGRGFFGEKCFFMSVAHRSRAARSFATSM
jgi:hypothetical protein